MPSLLAVLGLSVLVVVPTAMAGLKPQRAAQVANVGVVVLLLVLVVVLPRPHLVLDLARVLEPRLAFHLWALCVVVPLVYMAPHLTS